MKKGNPIVIKPLPIEVYEANTIYRRIIQLCLSWFHYYFKRPPYQATFLEFGNFIWIHNEHRHQIYNYGFFGKGSLSRSEPTWLSRTIEQHKLSLEDVTVERRKKRREKKRNQAIKDDQDKYQPDQLLDLVEYKDMETLQLDPCEAYFLIFALKALDIRNSKQKLLSIEQCWTKFCQNDPTFHYIYAVYHYYRSLGWVPKSGIKFGVDFVLYKLGPAYRHADYAVIIIPLQKGQPEDTKSWQWLLRLNRICTQVKKTLVLCYVTIPESINHIESYRIQEVVYRRWSAQKNRE
ncbi:hypothetical protein RMCBS344292_00160 [Rhizopus microsporus]|nr:hypothetical protein RMCBS344292_00160 [Rhizopus microsporus]